MGIQRLSQGIRVGTPQNVWGAESPDTPLFCLPGVPERAFCILYLDPSADRQSVLTAIFTRDKLGYAEVALLLPDPNRVLSRWVDFEAFATLRATLRARLVVIAWSPRLALLATWWHFPVPVAETVNHYVARFTGRPPQQTSWLIAVLGALHRFALVRWLGRAHGRAAYERASPHRTQDNRL